MNRRIVKRTHAYKVEIFIGGDFDRALKMCENYCTGVGLCVTVEPTTYAYRGGYCEGVRIGLINYARFPTEPRLIWDKATVLAEYLKIYLDQGSYTIQDDEISEFVSTRDEDQ